MTDQGLRAARTSVGPAMRAAVGGSVGVGIEAKAAAHTLRDGKQVLRPVSLAIRPGSLVAIIGPSGAGKTLLLDALAGVALPTEGAILHDGDTCRPHDDLALASIGYVPQDDIIHQALPLDRTLRYAARLRLPARTSAAQIDREVADVLAALGLTAHARTRVGLLSGGERKRASIAVELLSRPSALFLDEPTSGLDPAIAADLVELLGQIAASGTTVVFTSHNPADVGVCDGVVVLAAEGQMAFSGTPEDALQYFSADTFDLIYRRLAAEPDPAVWASRLPSARPVAGPARGATQAARSMAHSADAGRRIGPFGQWLLMSRRGVDLLTRSRLTLAILVGSPVLITLMFLMMFRPGAFDFAHPSPNTSMMILFWIAFGGFFFGLTYGLSQICDEFAIVRRERIVGLRIVPYLAAKVAVLLPILAVVDVLLLATLSATHRLPSMDLATWSRLLVTLLLTSISALALGLLAAAAVSSPAQATLMLPMLCFPQVLFVGAFLPVPVMALPGRILSYAMSNRWAFDALGATAGLPHLWRDGGSPLGPPLLDSYGDTFNGSVPMKWILLAAFTFVFLLAAALVLARKTPRRRRTSR
ncbi:MAG TPA: ATP-binding cassette domain-containing protein [Thermoleophilia bacterium]|nr:ATP-binding cassette domain-containing protein [Thermoleophilia bacterium]